MFQMFRLSPCKKSKILLAFFPYLAQIIISIRWCVACNDLWPWPIFSRSFDIDFENRVRSVTFLVLDQLFPYSPQIVTTIRGCVAFLVYNKNLNFDFSQIFIIFRLSPCFDLGPDMKWSIVWSWFQNELINSMGNHGAAGISSERRRSCCSSSFSVVLFSFPSPCGRIKNPTK